MYSGRERIDGLIVGADDEDAIVLVVVLSCLVLSHLLLLFFFILPLQQGKSVIFYSIAMACAYLLKQSLVF